MASSPPAYGATEPGNVELAPVEVVGARPKKRPHGPVEFTGDYAPKEPELPLGRAVETGRGVRREIVTQSEGQEPQFVVRGMAPIQQRFFLEGVSLGDASFGQSQLSWIPPESIAGVESYPDGIPLAFGADGLGGAHGLRWRAFQRCDDEVGMRAGSYGFVRLTGQRCFQPGDEPIAMRVAVTRSNENFRYRDDHGLPLAPETHTWEERKQNGFSEIQFAPSLVLSGGEFKAISLNRWFQKNVPGSVGAPRQALLNENSHGAFLYYEPSRSNFRQTGYLKWDDVTVQSLNKKFASPLPSQSRSLAFGTLSSLRGRVTGPWEGQLTLGAAAEELRTQDTRLGSLGASRWETPFGAGLSGPLTFLGASRVELRPAVQGHVYHYAPQSETFTEWSPRVGIEAPLSRGLRLKGAVGRYYRAPLLSERYGSAAGLVANPELKSESALKAVVGADISVKDPLSFVRSFRAGFDTGFSRADRLIAYEMTSPISQAARNIGTAEIFFHEMSVAIDFPLDVTAGLAVDWMATKNLGEGGNRGKALPFRPAYRLRPSLGYERSGWFAGYDAELVGPQFWDVANLKRGEAFWIHNVRLSYAPRSWGKFSIEVLNLADVTEVPAQFGMFQSAEFSSGFQGFPAPGRRGYLSWSYVF